ncbi:hypothetical protein ACTXI0_04625 [Arthrobacter rhombi]|uniref:hypothetical protein n=1 Tax=Arthrobacter rhombi TaxID=71253 RepID=UPI003FD64892
MMRRLYNAVCSWIEAEVRAKDKPDPEPQPEGSFAQVENAGPSGMPPELMHGTPRHGDEDEEGHAVRLGFNADHMM